MPGVIINTAVRTGPATPTAREASQAFFVGIADRGPVTSATLVRSIEDFEAVYGGFISSSMLHPTVETFFEEGGTQCYIARANAVDSVSASTNVEFDGDTAIVLEANGPGVWGNNLYAVVASGTASGTFTVKLYNDSELLMNTFNCASPDIAIGKINSHPLASKYVVASAGETTTNPDNGTYTFTGGDDGDAVTASVVAAALNLFLDSFGTGAVSCPEYSTDTMVEALIAHAQNNNRIAILHGASDDTQAEIKTFARAITADIESSEHAALYYPWVYSPTTIAGVNRLIPPDGYVCGKRSAAVNATGAHQPYAGLQSAARWVNGVVADINKADGDLLDEERVNAIRIIANTVRIYGARSLSPDDTNFRFINAQDIINGIVTEGYKTLEAVVFSTIDGRNRSLAAVESKLIGVLEQARLSGALYEAFDANGRRVDYGYTVKCDSSLNPVSQLATGLVKARVGVRVSSIGDKIEVNIVKSNLTTSVV